MKDILINSEELHIITSLPISQCRAIFSDNYLPKRTTLKAIHNLTKEDYSSNLSHFIVNWYNYHDNKDFILNDPFKDDGSFKIGRKIKFILNTILPEHRESIVEKWDKKKALLKQQLRFD